jgi:hypothetical protein
VEIWFTTMASALPLAKGGRVRVLGASGAKRTALLPEVPTMAGSRLQTVDVTVGFFFLTAAATPRPVVTALNREIVKAFDAQEIQSGQVVNRAAAFGAPQSNHRARGDPAARLGSQCRLQVECMTEPCCCTAVKREVCSVGNVQRFQSKQSLGKQVDGFVQDGVLGRAELAHGRSYRAHACQSRSDIVRSPYRQYGNVCRQLTGGVAELQRLDVARQQITYVLRGAGAAQGINDQHVVKPLA